MSDEDKLIHLYTDLFGLAPASVTQLAGAGSNRRYFRIISAEGSDIAPSLIGTVGTDAAENRSFIALARHFRQQGLPVPEIFAVSDDAMHYLQEDLGDISLFSMVKSHACTGGFDTAIIDVMGKTIEMLADVQYKGAKGLDWNHCSPKAMDGRMIRWDLNYFKYCFLKQVNSVFSESMLEDEFDKLYETLVHYAMTATTFMVRDFQSRNIMMRANTPYLIDFQGGRRGPAEYDVASFLWQAKAEIPEHIRNLMIDRYVGKVASMNPAFDESEFRRALPYFVLFRIMQTLGAYGYRGLSEGKPHFIASIPHAVSNLKSHIATSGLSKEFPYLAHIADGLSSNRVITDATYLSSIPSFAGLTVTVTSFSYKKGIPVDLSGNGGGFAFDCRGVHNPGRYEQYKALTGRDEAVKTFLEENGEIYSFLNNAWGLVDASVSRYLERGFQSLCVNFGCTGGRHRSVYSADATARHIAATYPQARIVLYHREQGILEIIQPSA